MGWMYTSKPKNQSVMEFFKENFDHETDLKKGEVIDCATVGWTEAYLAYRVTHKQTGRMFVIALVCLTHHSPGYYNFGYKDMDETMGPNVARCPERILNQLSPLDQIERNTTTNSYKYAQSWRQACRNRIERAKHLKKAKPGDVIEFGDIIRFVGGYQSNRFAIHTKKGQRVVLADVDHPSHAVCRMSRENIVSRKFNILATA